MSNKILTLFDGNSYRDSNKLSPSKTDIKICIHGTNTVVFRGSNKVIIPGAGFTARAHFDLVDNNGAEITDDITPNYDDAILMEAPSEALTEMKGHKCYLFAVGIDGADGNSVYPVNYIKWIDPVTGLVPFIYGSDDITSEEDKEKYHGKVINNGIISYYFKTFEAKPILRQKYSNDSDVDINIYNQTSPDLEAETYVEVKLSVTKDECRTFFAGTGNARINTISLLTAEKYELNNGNTYYKNIRPLTKLNFPTESLVDTTKGLDITYHIYY